MDFPLQPSDKPLRLKPLESDIKHMCDEKVRAMGGYVVQVNQDERNAKGVPDRVYCFRGRFVAVEFKRDKRTYVNACQLQNIHCELIRKAGGIAIITWKWEDIQKVLEEIKDGI